MCTAFQFTVVGSLVVLSQRLILRSGGCVILARQDSIPRPGLRKASDPAHTRIVNLDCDKALVVLECRAALRGSSYAKTTPDPLPPFTLSSSASVPPRTVPRGPF